MRAAFWREDSRQLGGGCRDPCASQGFKLDETWWGHGRVCGFQLGSGVESTAGKGLVNKNQNRMKMGRYLGVELLGPALSLRLTVGEAARLFPEVGGLHSPAASQGPCFSTPCPPSFSMCAWVFIASLVRVRVSH